ncbi:hypothetical protein GCM10010347_63680 [Streptomyces cirratus]|uniref:Uncharacterized protein n=1 Tax=Streptomyces cirratus TaxID=68187 RepID=A0ABQ3F544_9ACTN|nr:hypothetical protein GCM10010347_63680 [Streptomyces cirratus]
MNFPAVGAWRQGLLVAQAPLSLLYAPAPVRFNSPAARCDCLAHVYGNAADHPDRVRWYPSDMTESKWAAVWPLLARRVGAVGGGEPVSPGYVHAGPVDRLG